MSRIAIITRGDAWWGLGHLHRVGWLWLELCGSGVPALELRVFCLDSPQARSHRWPQGAEVEFIADPVAMAVTWVPDVIVVDWLDSDQVVISRLKEQGSRLALLDDYGPAGNAADLVINALLSPLAASERQTEQHRRLSGARYVQFPPAVTKLRGVANASANAMAAELTSPLVRRIFGQPQEPARAVLVSFGGQSVEPAVQLSLQALQLAKYTGKVIVMPAPAESNRPALHQGDGVSRLDIEWLPAGPEFHTLLSAVDIAILAGGLSLYEAAFLGIPALCIALREHQLATALKLEAAGTCRSAGMLEQLAPGELAAKLSTLIRSEDLRGLMSAKGLALFDGLGLRRTAEAIISLL
jgi:spore coat polysaccharide biosynthesis predicted glycosyltransferase SpsG